MEKFYNGPKVGIITEDSIMIRAFLENKHIEYFVLYGDDSEPGCETCFVTLNPLDETLIERIKGYDTTEGFALLRKPSEFSKYIIENTYGRLAEAIKQKIPPGAEISELSGIASFMNLDEFGVFFNNL